MTLASAVSPRLSCHTTVHTDGELVQIDVTLVVFGIAAVDKDTIGVCHRTVAVARRCRSRHTVAMHLPCYRSYGVPPIQAQSVQ
jgi:hypothetical protein